MKIRHLLFTGLLAIAQMLFSRGMELLIGFGFGLLLWLSRERRCLRCRVGLRFGAKEAHI